MLAQTIADNKERVSSITSIAQYVDKYLEKLASIEEALSVLNDKDTENAKKP